MNTVTYFLLLIFLRQYSAQITERISQKKCREYTPLRYGIHKNSCPLSDDAEAVYGQFPHMALIETINNDGVKEWGCSGILISDEYILAPGYCERYGSYTAKLGVLRFSNSTNEPYTQEIKIIKTIRHPMYKPPSQYNNILLYKLEHPVEINEYVRPACLPDLNEKQNEYILVGWPTLSADKNKSSEIVLTKQNKIDEYTNEDCSTHYKMDQRRLKMGIDAESQLCVGPPEIVCKWLGGSPLQTLKKNEDCVYYIHAFSYLGARCPAPKPTLFMRIAPYISWIESVVWPLGNVTSPVLIESEKDRYIFT